MNGFVDTGDRLLTSLSTQPSLKIYSQAVSQGDCIDFGANKANGFGGGTVSNYLVFMKEVASGPPEITDQPDSVTVVEGQEANFTIGAKGAAPLHYQWYWEGFAAGTDSPEFNIPDCYMPDNGSKIYCIVSNEYGTATSDIAILTVVEGVPCTPLDDRFEAATISEGLEYYTDRSYTLTNVSQYAGYNAILLPNDERNRTDPSGYVTFTMIGSTGEVYVAYDSRATSLPDWMDGFTDTGHRFLTSLSTQPSLKIYRKDYQLGDCVDFGANKAEGFAGNIVSNYIVLYKD
jgi:hypothetical protein